jgi:hypothetical protein
VALLPVGHDVIVPIGLIGDHVPAADKQFEDCGLGQSLRQRQQPAAFRQLSPAMVCAVHFESPELSRSRSAAMSAIVLLLDEALMRMLSPPGIKEGNS